MNSIYEQPSIELIECKEQDIITTSPGINLPDISLFSEAEREL